MEKCYISHELLPRAIPVMEPEMTETKVFLPKDNIADFCRRWKIVEFSLFGSVLRSDFGPESDIDILVSFAPNAAWKRRLNLPSAGRARSTHSP